ncbi:hypothetical protein PsorP6_011524 [Peronosclerospora sorghi]|uniref:Uncharacterized protein n=1 Tax=Peronosclerospora sorghi TaxID=230839 RepID=A0ACC0WM04_9STRA|nr:hypothetical protein PsorP6_011524 [Peronosclerospora sorghi]
MAVANKKDVVIVFDLDAERSVCKLTHNSCKSTVRQTDRSLTVGKKLEIIAEADRTGFLAATAQKYGKKNIERLRATYLSRLVCASTIQRGHLVFNETYAQYWVGYNKFCSIKTNYDELRYALRVTYKDVMREVVSTSMKLEDNWRVGLLYVIVNRWIELSSDD